MTLLLDDFSAEPPASAAAWKLFTDRVMGGVSTGDAAVEIVHGRRALRMRGLVSLERNGGFVQMARALGAPGAAERDASAYAGIALTVCGSPGRYFVHLRTLDTRVPWQYYSAPLPVSETWTEVRLDWAAFTPQALVTPLDTSRLLRIGVVAGFSEFAADVSVEQVAFFR